MPRWLAIPSKLPTMYIRKYRLGGNDGAPIVAA